MKREINELRRRDGLFTAILNALTSDRKVPAIRQSLKNGEDPVFIMHAIDTTSKFEGARIATSSRGDHKTTTPQNEQPGLHFELAEVSRE